MIRSVAIGRSVTALRCSRGETSLWRTRMMKTVYPKEVHYPGVVLRHMRGVQQRLLSTTTTADRDEGLQWTAPLNPSHPKAVPGPTGVPSRHAQVQRLMASSAGDPYDVLVIGGGATGAGIALDAVTRELDPKFAYQSNNLLTKVACIERGDFASETSSRSTKLIWAGIRYLATASATLLSKNLWHSPLATVQEFLGEMKMVLNCHRERRYMTSEQPHLTNWVPIAIPFSTWHVSPPPFGHWLFGFFPILAPGVLKLYDAMSSFTCPPSYVMGSARAKAVFPQLCDRVIKYCAVFYEAQHNDARTNIAIAMTAAEHGAHISNYIEMIDVLRDSSHRKNNQRVVGVRAVDRMTGIEFDIHAKQVVFAGGPFTDSLRQLEFQSNDKTEPTNAVTNTSSNPVKEAIMKPAVNGASGTHLVLPGYYCPNNMGLLDYNTSDGRFLFFLPWEKHTLVGTTDTKCAAETLPKPPEDEVQWLLNECSKYLSPDLRVRRSDVLSAWRGWRPLAVDPHAPPGAPASRDHIISLNPESGVLFVAGGKWTTWREMAQDVVDRIVGPKGPKCKTLTLPLFGRDGYSPNLSVQLIQKHGMTQDTGEHLARAYGGRAWDVCELSQPTQTSWPRFGVGLAPNYPYQEAEVIYACREYACTVEDVLSRRTRLAFLNKDAALAALDRVADIMAMELGWSDSTKQEQKEAARSYVESYAGRIPNKAGSTLREAAYRDITDIFNAIDTDGSGFLDRVEVGEVAIILGFPLTAQELDQAFSQMDKNKNGRVDLEEFETWWNHAKDNELHRKLSKELGIGGLKGEEIKTMGGGVFLG